MPSIDIETRLAVNGVTPTDVAQNVWERFAHHFYDRPQAFARDFAEYVGNKRDWTQEQIDDLRWNIAERIAPHAVAADGGNQSDT